MYNECRHILPNGNRCQSPALRHHDFCYFHSVHRAQPPVEATFDLNLPPLEDPDAIQLALSQLAQALAANFRHTIAGQRLLQKKSEPQQDPAPALYEQQMVRETCSHSDGTPIAPPKECPDPEEVPEPEHKWSLGRLLLRDAEEFRQRKLKEQAELERQIRDTQRGARFFGFEPDPPQPDTLPALEATAEDNPPVLKNLQKNKPHVLSTWKRKRCGVCKNHYLHCRVRHIWKRCEVRSTLNSTKRTYKRNSPILKNLQKMHEPQEYS